MDRGEYRKDRSTDRREHSLQRRDRSSSHGRERSSHRKDRTSHKRKHSSRKKERSPHTASDRRESRDRSSHERKRSSHRKEGAATSRRERSPHRKVYLHRKEHSSPHRRERSPHRAKRFPPEEHLRTPETNVLTYKKLQQMPVNLRKKAIREARSRNEEILSNRKGKKKKTKSWITARRQCNAAECSEHNNLVDSTEQELRQILQGFDVLSDIPCDCTATELLGEIAIAEGNATTIFVERDGLSTLTIVLHQPEPTIAQLKKAIAVISRAEHKRRQRERHEESLRRRGLADGGPEDPQRQQQVAGGAMPSSTGELVYSALRNGHDHRAFVSWHFLWRCFGLFNVETNQPIDDRSNGRATLTELGIENAAALKFVHRVKYFGCQRQK
ncbi:uncharacterized protein [Drosophila pseudoobscura]|uniref:SNRNP25 ubiquitin-like domain-containing protein n=1 Tax=Drosophila pseudoobscura pseudoobscura TaxID=46245 RepID=A0A6I8UY08_DROPS|nr:uncharacterized protein LOC6903277 [Drosophila pseudoobscura]